MNLIIDIGNTQLKYAIFEKGEMLEFCVSEIQDITLIEGWQKKYQNLDAAIVSSVQGKPDTFLDKLKPKFKSYILVISNVTYTVN